MRYADVYSGYYLDSAGKPIFADFLHLDPSRSQVSDLEVLTHEAARDYIIEHAEKFSIFMTAYLPQTDNYVRYSVNLGNRGSHIEHMLKDQVRFEDVFAGVFKDSKNSEYYLAIEYLKIS